MRVLLFFIGACFMWPALAGNELADCAEIESAVERLDCYDRLVRQASREKPSEGEESADTERRESLSTPPSEPERGRAAKAPVAKSAPSDQAGNKTVDRDIDDVELFGKEHQRAPVVNIDHIDARIESIRKAPRGQHIMTLSNGQIWMENEPGRRSIEPDQDVTIKKHRWHYEMELKSQPNVAVRRVD